MKKLGMFVGKCEVNFCLRFSRVLFYVDGKDISFCFKIDEIGLIISC